MQIEVEYGTQVRTASGRSREVIEVPETCTLAEALQRLLHTYPQLAPWIEPSGQPRPGLLIFLNNQASGDIEQTNLHSRDQLALLTLISGG